MLSITYASSNLLGYRYKVEWVPGKNHVIADALLRAPVFAAKCHDDILIRKVAEVVPDLALTELAEQAKFDGDFQRVITALRKGASIKKLNSRHPAKRYQGQWDAMAVEKLTSF